MKYVTVEHDGRERPGVLDGDTVQLLSATDLTGVITDGASVVDTIPFRPELLRAPLRRFRRDILCTGWNYWDHFEESKGKREGQDVDRPEHPTFFTKGPDVVIGPYDDIAWDPAISAKWDYEAEVALVIGKTGKNIAVADALDHVWGYTLANDVSQRDLQRAHGGQWLKGKSIDGTMPLGPHVVTRDEIDLANVRLECFVNGDAREPSRKACLGPKLREVRERLDVRLLHHVLGIGLAAKDGPRGAIEASVVTTNEDFVELSFARKDALDDGFVGSELGALGVHRHLVLAIERGTRWRFPRIVHDTRNRPRITQISTKAQPVLTFEQVWLESTSNQVVEDVERLEFRSKFSSEPFILVVDHFSPEQAAEIRRSLLPQAA